MASLSSYYPQPVIAGTTAGTYAEGNDSRIEGAVQESGLSDAEVLASGSTEERSLATRFAETVKVADFGAVGNGTTDDAGAIQSAIDYAISLGNAVIEFEPKTYNLVATKAYRSTAQYPIIQNRCHLDVHGGTNSTKLIFKGNGAILYSNVSASNAIGEMLLIASRLNSIEFDNITFERGPAQRSSLPPVDGSVLVAMFPISEDAIQYVRFTGVYFINGMAFHASNRTYSVSKTIKKIKTLEFLNCQFLYPYGACSTLRSLGGGGQMVNLSSWIDVLVAEGCLIDGAVGGKVPTWALPVDGWNYLNSYHTNISNCHFRNCAIESVITQTPWNIVANINGFTQPAVNNTVTVTAKSIQDNNNEELVVGNLYLVRDLNLSTGGYTKTWAHGVYRLENWENPIANSTITLRRVSDYHALTPEPVVASQDQFRPEGTVFSNDCVLLMLDGADASASIDSCTFTGETITDTDGKVSPLRIIVTSGGSGYASAPNVIVSHGDMTATASVSNGSVTGVNITNYTDFTKYDPTNPPTISFSGGGGSNATATVEMADWRHDPAIFQGNIKTTISNCYFEGKWHIKIGQDSGDYGSVGPTTVVNNAFYLKPFSKVNPNKKSDSIFSHCPNSIIANNTFLVDNANLLSYFIAIGASHQLIANNSFVAKFASTDGYEAFAILTRNSDSNATWQTYVDNNYFLNLHYGISGNSPCQVGQMRGIFLTKPVNFSSGGFAGSQLFFVSPNGQSKIFSLTDDGEIQITT
jgi:hypothetical protein